MTRERPGAYPAAAVKRQHIAAARKTIIAKTPSITLILKTLSLTAAPIAARIAVQAFMLQTNGAIPSTRPPSVPITASKRITPRFARAAAEPIGRKAILQGAFHSCRIRYVNAAKRLRATPVIITDNNEIYGSQTSKVRLPVFM